MNWVAIVVAAIVDFALGAVWFGPLFGKQWQEMTGRRETTTPARNAPVPYAVTFVAALIAATVLAFFLQLSTAYTVVEGTIYGLYAGVGFVMSSMLADALFSGRKLSLYLITAGYPAVGLVVMGAILGAWH